MATDLDLLFERSLDGLFVYTLDQPLRWDPAAPAADKAAWIDTLFDHLRLTRVNDALCRQFGASRDAMLGTTPRSRWMHDVTEWRRRIQRLYDAGQSRHTSPVRRADGAILMVEGSYACTYDDAGRVTGHIGVTRDVTERLADEERLRASQARLDAAQELGRIGDFVHDLVTGHAEWSTGLFRLHGIPPERGVPPFDQFLELVHPDDRERTRRLPERIGDRPLLDLFRTIRPDGEVRQLSIRVRADRGPDGAPVRLIGTVQDVSEVQGALAHASQREAQFRYLFDHSLEGLFFMTLDQPIRWDDDADKDALLDYAFDHLRITEVNDAMCRQLGGPREAVLGVTARVRWGHAAPDWRRRMRELYDDGQAHYAGEAVQLDGKRIQVDGDYVCLYDADGRITGHFGVQRDVTRRREIEERLRLAERMASIGTLSAGVAHEINNPLAFVLGNLHHLAHVLGRAAGGVPAAEIADLREVVADAVTGAERVAAIVRDLRTFARGDAAALAPVAVDDVVEFALHITGNQLRQRARIERTREAVPPVRGNATRLGQVFTNLLVNAAQAIPEGDADTHRIRVATRRAPDGRVTVEVADTGGGMTPDVQRRIFDPFFTTKPVGDGVGLGLSICHAIVGEAGGEIVVDSAPGAGTRITVLLVPAEPATATPGGAAALAAAARRQRFLVVDDEAMTGDLFVRLLEGHDVVAETRGADALARIERGERFDRIFCDLMMPTMSGAAFFARLPDEVRPAVVFMTGGAFTPGAADFLDDVANPRLDKPFGLDDLEALLGFQLG